jgi:hypothetical protein
MSTDLCSVILGLKVGIGFSKFAKIGLAFRGGRAYLGRVIPHFSKSKRQMFLYGLDVVVHSSLP